MRMHRSFIVRIDKISAIDAPDVIMGDQMGCIPIGDPTSARSSGNRR